MKFPSCTLILACLLCLPSAPAQPPVGAGHWLGSILVPHQEIVIEVDLSKNSKGEWIGSIDIPAQNTKGFPLSDVAVTGTSVTFGMKGPPGDPKFEGKLLPNGKAISGTYTQGGVSLTFSLKRTSDAFTPPNSTEVAKEMEGLWEGSLEGKGNTLRLKLSLSNQPDGTATGTLAGADPGGGAIPITTITQRGSKLKLELRTIQVSYDGDLTDGAIVGHWTQMGAKSPLTFRRPQEAQRPQDDKK